MRPREFACRQCRFRIVLLVAVIMSAGVRADDEPMGWSPDHIPPEEPWREGALELPDYPAEKRLAAIPVHTANYPYDVYVDTGSLGRGKDGVVRYTVVVRSNAGAENISYEGLHCGERTFRRFAYGYGGKWQQVDGGNWRHLEKGGMNHYRYVLYSDYLCDPTDPLMKMSEMIQRMRSSQGMILDD